MKVTIEVTEPEEIQRLCSYLGREASFICEQTEVEEKAKNTKFSKHMSEQDYENIRRESMKVDEEDSKEEHDPFKPTFPKVWGKGKETVLAVLSHIGGGGTIREIANETEYDKTSINNFLLELKSEGKVNSRFVNGDARTRYYYLKDEGDPEAKEALKNFIGKVSNF